MANKIFNFPDIDYWRQNVLKPNDEQRFKKKCFYDYYLQKYIIARLYRPKRIAEIGVRYGYSAYSFLCACPDASYTGFDVKGVKRYGGTGEDVFVYVDKLLKTFTAAKIELIYQNTQAIDELPGKYDFIHVDGNHKEHGCLHDMQMAWRALLPGGVILVDDDIKIAGVRRAIDTFIKHYYKLIDYYYRMPSLTGEVVIRKPSI